MIVRKKLFGEDKHVEFKAEIPKRHEKFLKDIIAFANTSGGKTIVGVEDETGKVVGLGDQNPFKLSDAISNMIKIQCALFKGTERDEFIDKKEFRGPIQRQVEEAYQFVLRHINRSAVIEGLHRHDTYELPTQSIREIIANACLHRSYLDSSAIQVSIYDDRLEVDSPGMLYDGLNVTDALAGKSKCRNTAIAEAFQYMKLIEGWGTGLPRLFRQCREMNLPEPKFEEFGDGIKVTVYRANGANEANAEADEANREANEAESGTIQDQILRLIKANSKISQTRIAEEIGVSRSTIQRAFGKLIESGQVQRTGGTRGSWIIQEKH